MSAEYFRRMVQQCQNFLARARTDVALAQLRLWIIGFQSEAEAAERGAPQAFLDRGVALDNASSRGGPAHSRVFEDTPGQPPRCGRRLDLSIAYEAVAA